MTVTSIERPVPSVNELYEAARRYRAAGLSVIPASLAAKYPTGLLTWKPYSVNLAAETELRPWFRSGSWADAIAIVCGRVSGNMEVIDFDHQAMSFHAWAALVEEMAPGLLDRLYLETSQSGGRHVAYRCAEPVSGNQELALAELITVGGAPFEYCGELFTPEWKDAPGGRGCYELMFRGKRVQFFQVKASTTWRSGPVLIETRAEGGLILCSPSPRYEALRGRLEELPVITAEERELLLTAARSLTEVISGADASSQPPPPAARGGLKPGDDYNARGDVRDLLHTHGWLCVRGGENEYWRRPGKSAGWSATLKTVNGRLVFYVFSSNAPPFEASHVYSPFAVLAALEYAGNYSTAAAALRNLGYGSAAPTSPKRGRPTPSGTSGTGPAGENPEIWPEPKPIPDDLSPVPPFDMELLPRAFAPWIRDVSERMQCPPDYPAVAAMVALASVVGRRVGIRPKRYDEWLVVVNLWGFIVGPPSQMKTPAMEEAMKPLKRLEIDAKKQFEKDMQAWDVSQDITGAQKKARTRAIRQAVDSGEDPVRAAATVSIDEGNKPTRRRYIVNDSTIEKTGELLNENPNGLLWYRDELAGFLRALDKDGYEGARQFYLEA